MRFNKTENEVKNGGFADSRLAGNDDFIQRIDFPIEIMKNFFVAENKVDLAKFD